MVRQHKIDRILSSLKTEEEALELVYVLLNTLPAQCLDEVRIWLNKNSR